MKGIYHLWFDFSETIAFLHKDAHDVLRYTTYASVVGREDTQELRDEYEVLYARHSKSNAAIFRSLGMPANFWSEQINALPPEKLYRLASPDVPEVLRELREVVPLSIFSNIELDSVLSVLGIDSGWFTHIISAGMVKEPKPALDGFRKIVEFSALPAGEILYVGDDVKKDILPAQQVGILAGLMWKQAPEADYCFGNFQELLSFIND